MNALHIRWLLVKATVRLELALIWTTRARNPFVWARRLRGGRRMRREMWAALEESLVVGKGDR